MLAVVAAIIFAPVVRLLRRLSGNDQSSLLTSIESSIEPSEGNLDSPLATPGEPPQTEPMGAEPSDVDPDDGLQATPK